MLSKVRIPECILETTVIEEVMRTVEDAMDDENTCEFYTLFKQGIIELLATHLHRKLG